MPQDSSSALALVVTEAAPPCPDPVACNSGSAGPGWFDSSWELRRGLEVMEDWSGDERLHGWIENFLRGQRSAAGRTVSPSESTAIA